MSEIREKIINYLQSKNKLDIAAKCVYLEKKDIQITAKQQGVEYRKLKRKVEIMKQLPKDFKQGCAFRRAVLNVLNEKENITEAAMRYKLDPEILSEEIDKCKKLEKRMLAYYDKPTNINTGIFTFDEELLLLKRLCQWKQETLLPCTCQICAMEYLLSLAYQFVQEEKKQYPKEWDIHKRADEEWLIDFEMIHGIKLSIMFSQNCKKKLLQFSKR